MNWLVAGRKIAATSVIECAIAAVVKTGVATAA